MLEQCEGMPAMFANLKEQMEKMKQQITTMNTK